jgi:hypothetical protein
LKSGVHWFEEKEINEETVRWHHPHSTTEAELRTLFAAHGAIEQVSVVTDRDTGRLSRGFAFVEMTDWEKPRKQSQRPNGKELADAR